MKTPPIVQDEISAPRTIKRDFRALEVLLVRESGAQVIFPLSFQLQGDTLEKSYSSEGTGEDGGVEGLLSASRNGHCEELSLKKNHKQAKNLWVRITDQVTERPLWLLSPASCLIKGNLLMKSCSSYRSHCTHWLLSVRGTSSATKYSGKVAW